MIRKKYKRTDNNRRIQHIVHIRSFDHVQSHVCLKPWIISDTAVSFQQVNEHSSHNLFSFLHSFNRSVLLLRSSFCLVMSYFNTSIIFHTANRYNTTTPPPPPTPACLSISLFFWRLPPVPQSFAPGQLTCTRTQWSLSAWWQLTDMRLQTWVCIHYEVPTTSVHTHRAKKQLTTQNHLFHFHWNLTIYPRLTENCMLMWKRLSNSA